MVGQNADDARHWLAECWIAQYLVAGLSRRRLGQPPKFDIRIPSTRRRHALMASRISQTSVHDELVYDHDQNGAELGPTADRREITLCEKAPICKMLDLTSRQEACAE